MIKNTSTSSTASTLTSTFNQLPAEVRTLFTIFVIGSLAAVGHTDVPDGQGLRSLAAQAYDDLGIKESMLSDPIEVSHQLDAYFRKTTVRN